MTQPDANGIQKIKLTIDMASALEKENLYYLLAYAIAQDSFTATIYRFIIYSLLAFFRKLNSWGQRLVDFYLQMTSKWTRNEGGIASFSVPFKATQEFMGI